jgi:hypothetical protein
LWFDLIESEFHLGLIYTKKYRANEPWWIKLIAGEFL